MNDLDFWLSGKDVGKPVAQQNGEDVTVKVTPVADLSTDEDAKAEQTSVRCAF